MRTWTVTFPRALIGRRRRGPQRVRGPIIRWTMRCSATYTHRRILPVPNCPEDETRCCVQRRSAERKTRQRGRVLQCTVQCLGPDCRGGRGSLVDMHMRGMICRVKNAHARDAIQDPQLAQLSCEAQLTHDLLLDLRPQPLQILLFELYILARLHECLREDQAVLRQVSQVPKHRRVFPGQGKEAIPREGENG